MDRNQGRLKVVMLPWLAHGHISPFLELAKRLVLRNFSVYFCSTPVNLSSIKEQQVGQCSSEIEFIELQLPNHPNLPPYYHTTRSLPPHLLPTLIKAFDSAKPAFSDLVGALKPDCIIYDTLQPWAPEAASEQNIPAIAFLITGVTCILYPYILANQPENGNGFPFPTVELGEFETLKIRQTVGNKSSGTSFFERSRLSLERSSGLIATKSLREIEGKFMDRLSVLTEKEIVPIGLLAPQVQNWNQTQPCLVTEWLEEKEKGSVVFVSFGSEYYMSREEIEEMAGGLELSGQNFVWVVRFPNDGKEPKKIEEALPCGFLERVGERGKVVMGWAEQEKILSHPSTGGFLTHCGWSSFVEGLRLGLPLIALPLQFDQPINARLGVGELGVGVEIERERCGNGRFTKEKVAKGIKAVMVDKEGEGVRRAAKELAVRLNCREDVEIDVFAEKLMKICRESKESGLRSKETKKAID